jgi:hypothetical protein
MTPYLIFVTVLTIAYIIYYGYHISKDLYGKKGEASDTAEVFDVASLQDEVTATPVREMDGGFSLGDNEVVQSVPTPAAPASGADKYDSIREEMEETDVQSEGGLTAMEMEEFLATHNVTDLFRKSKIKETRETY